MAVNVSEHAQSSKKLELTWHTAYPDIATSFISH
jgi:hypothetical protein